MSTKTSLKSDATVSCGGKTASLVTKTPLLDEGDAEAKRAEILKYFHDSFTLYESLFECLANDQAFYTRANRLRQPLICLLYTSPSPRDGLLSRMPSSA